MNFVSLWITDASVCGCSSSLGLCSGSMYRQIMRGGSGGRARCRSLPLTLHDRWTVVAAAGVGAGGSGGGGDAGSRCAPAAPAAPTGAYRPGVTAAPPQRPRRPTPHAPTRSRRWPPPTRRRPPGAAPVPARSLERIPQAARDAVRVTAALPSRHPTVAATSRGGVRCSIVDATKRPRCRRGGPHPTVGAPHRRLRAGPAAVDRRQHHPATPRRGDGGGGGRGGASTSRPQVVAVAAGGRRSGVAAGGGRRAGRGEAPHARRLHAGAGTRRCGVAVHGGPPISDPRGSRLGLATRRPWLRSSAPVAMVLFGHSRGAVQGRRSRG